MSNEEEREDEEGEVNDENVPKTSPTGEEWDLERLLGLRSLCLCPDARS